MNPSAAVPAPAQSNTELTKEDVVFLIRWSAQMDAERIQTIVDSAILAAEQVQDKRIDLLTQGPEVTATDLIFDVLLTFVLESTLIGIPARAAAQKIVTPLLRKAGAIVFLPRPSVRRAYRDNLEFARQFGRYAVQGVRQATVSREDLRKYHVFMRGITRADGDINEALVAGAKTVKEANAPQAPALAPGDSPGVAVLKAAQSYASAHRAAIAMVHAQLEMAALVAKDKAALEKVADMVEIEPLEQDLSVLRDGYALLYEAAIWVMLFGLADGSKIRAGGGLLDGGRNVKLAGVTTPLLRYWESRFASVISNWLAQLERDLGATGISKGAGLLPLKGPFANADPDLRASYVNQFFKQVAKDLPELPEASWTTSVIKPRT